METGCLDLALLFKKTKQKQKQKGGKWLGESQES